ncbi:MAG: molybdate ABC transporter substrate-binding protein [Nocardioidaceae bacterium]|nr:molybdate ABC transporter substrate-binding protein [Nocardioidaceae bacterium]
MTGLTACSSDENTDVGEDAKLTVFAASSLTQTFGTLEEAFEKERPEVDVVVSFDSSTTLAEQVSQGAPADVIATADQTSMQIVAEAELLSADPAPFASNTLVVVTPADNPAGMQSLGDLDTADFVLCDPAAPCGAASAQILDTANITAPAKSLEPNVAAVLNKVRLGEADAGLVYVTDAQAAGDDVATVNIPAGGNVVNPYYIAAVQGSPEPDLAEEWIALVSSQAGQRVLQEAGFGPP